MLSGKWARLNRLAALFIVALGVAWAQAEAVAPGPQDLQPRPTPMGVSISNTPSLPFIYAGTAGLLVRSATNPNIQMILSNNHVLGAKGPDLCPNDATPGTFALQPGTLDIGNDPGPDPDYVVGAFAGFMPISFAAGASNLIDAALAFTSPSLAKSEILNLGEPNPTLDAGIIALPGMAVTKSGRTTGTTNGTVSAVNLTVLVSYGSCGTARFVNQVSITPGTFSGPGDSGSAILDVDTRQPVGLLFAGSSTQTIANQMLLVYLILRVVPEGAVPAAVTEQRVAQLSQDLYARHPRIRALQRIQQDAEADLFRIAGVHGVGIARADEARNDGEYALLVYADRVTASLRRAVMSRLAGQRVRIVEQTRFRAF